LQCFECDADGERFAFGGGGICGLAASGEKDGDESKEKTA
jgi:hypothetical protein